MLKAEISGDSAYLTHASAITQPRQHRAIAGLSPHDFRRTFVCNAGVDLQIAFARLPTGCRILAR
ncbi:MAG: hypothetical protein LVS60_18605 [Nodosilinea sp. LVE1205-7]